LVVGDVAHVSLPFPFAEELSVAPIHISQQYQHRTHTRLGAKGDLLLHNTVFAQIGLNELMDYRIPIADNQIQGFVLEIGALFLRRGMLSRVAVPQ